MRNLRFCKLNSTKPTDPFFALKDGKPVTRNMLVRFLQGKMARIFPKFQRKNGRGLAYGKEEQHPWGQGYKAWSANWDTGNRMCTWSTFITTTGTSKRLRKKWHSEPHPRQHLNGGFYSCFLLDCSSWCSCLWICLWILSLLQVLSVSLVCELD